MLGIRDEYVKASDVMNITPWVEWLDEEAKEKEFEALGQRICGNIGVIIANRDKIAEVQSKIKKWLEELYSMLGYPVLVWNRSNGFRIKRARSKGFVERKTINGGG